MKVWRRPCDQLEDGARERPDIAVLGCVVFTLDDFRGHCDTGGITPSAEMCVRKRRGFVCARSAGEANAYRESLASASQAQRPYSTFTSPETRRLTPVGRRHEGVLGHREERTAQKSKVCVRAMARARGSGAGELVRQRLGSEAACKVADEPASLTWPVRVISTLAPVRAVRRPQRSQFSERPCKPLARRRTDL